MEIPAPKSPRLGYAARIATVMLAVSLLGIALGFAVEAATDTGSLLTADVSLAKALHDRACDSWLWTTALALSIPGWPIVLYVVVGVAIIVLWRRHERAYVAFFVITGLAGGTVDTIIKEVVGRDRPGLGGCNVGLEGKSFPSGHVMMATICYGMLLYVFLPRTRAPWQRRLLIGWVVAALLASMFARSTVGAHFISDLIGGLLLGALWLAGATWAFNRWRAATAAR